MPLVYNHNTSTLNYQFHHYIVFITFLLLLSEAQMFFVCSSSRTFAVIIISHRNFGITFNSHIIFKHNYSSIIHILIFMCLESSLESKTQSCQHAERKANNLIIFFNLGFVNFTFTCYFYLRKMYFCRYINQP